MLIKTIFLVALLCGACASAPDRAELPVPRRGLPVYDGNVIIDPAARTLSARWHVAFVPDSATADTVNLLLNRGLRVTSLTGAHVAAFTQMEADGWNRIALRFTPDVVPGAPIRFDVAYAGVPVFSEDSINSVRAGWIELGLDGAWHPVFATYDQYITGSFQLTAPAGWQLVASGSTTRDRQGLRVLNRIPLIDMAFVAAPAFREVSAPAATIYHVNADTAVVGRVLQTAAACAAYLDERYGAREKLPHVKIVLAPRNGPGYARTNYIVITDVAKLPPDALSRFLCHELAHFWSSGAIASGPENWLNEAFAEFVALRYVRSVHGQEAFDRIMNQFRTISEKQPAVWTPTGTARPSGMVAYRKAPYLLHRLEERLGTEVMDRILARRMSERVTTTRTLLTLVAEVAGREHSDWFASELGK